MTEIETHSRKDLESQYPSKNHRLPALPDDILPLASYFRATTYILVNYR